jgi:hypothetical protein
MATGEVAAASGMSEAREGRQKRLCRVEGESKTSERVPLLLTIMNSPAAEPPSSAIASVAHTKPSPMPTLDSSDVLETRSVRSFLTFPFSLAF